MKSFWGQINYLFQTDYIQKSKVLDCICLPKYQLPQKYYIFLNLSEHMFNLEITNLPEKHQLWILMEGISWNKWKMKYNWNTYVCTYCLGQKIHG